MVRIIQIIPNLKKGGAERLVLDICNELVKREGIILKIIVFSEQNDYKFLTQNLDLEYVSASISLSLIKKSYFNIDNLQLCIDKFKPDIINSHLYEAEIVSRSCNYLNTMWFSHSHDNMKQFRNLTLSTFFYKHFFTNYIENEFEHLEYKNDKQ